MKTKLLAIGALFIIFSSPGNARDSGNLKGDPTPAMAMYVAQTTFAAEKCVAERFTVDEKGAASLVKYFNRVARLDLYKKKHPDFVESLEAFLGTYSAAWNGADQDIAQMLETNADLRKTLQLIKQQDQMAHSLRRMIASLQKRSPNVTQTQSTRGEQ